MNRRIVVVASFTLLCACTDSTSVAPVSLTAYRIMFDGPGTVARGDTIHVRVATYSGGRVGSWKIRIYLSANQNVSSEDVPLGDLTAEPSLAPDYYANASMAEGSVRIPPGIVAGRYVLGAIVDPDAQLPDTSREDNVTAASGWLGVAIAPGYVGVAPAPASPADRALFANGDTVTLSWSSVAGAKWYQVELDECPLWTDAASWWSSCTTWFVAADRWQAVPSWTITFRPNGAGRWRIRGIDSLGMLGPPSPWQTFRFQ